MVSFFGLKFGDKKKKSGGSAQAKQSQQWKRIDQNTLGEGQFFGQNIGQMGVINGSSRSVSRAGTPQPGGSSSGRSPYAGHATHNLAAASMFDLATAPAHRGSQTSLHLKLHASDVNLRTRFGANNASSASLAIPAPGFASRFGANNRSSTSLAAPGPGFGSRPGTPSRTKAWVNPLDIHFMRSAPSAPPAATSPLASSSAIQLPPTPTTETAETESVFGEDADDMVDAVIASVKKREEEAKQAREKEKELEKQMETARLEMERLERQKSTESNMSGRRPSLPQLLPEPQKRLRDAPSLPGPQFRGDVDERPGSRGSPIRGPPLHQGPPPTGPPTQRLPQPPGRGPPRHGPLGPVEAPSGRGPRPPGPPTNGPAHRPNGVGTRDPAPQASPQRTIRSCRPPPLQGSGLLGPLPDALRSPSQPLSTPGIKDHRSQSPGLRNPPTNECQPSMVHPEAQAPAENGRSTPLTETQGLEPLISTLTSPSTVTSPSGSIRRLSLDDEPVEQFARPIIQNVGARRDTLTLGTPRQQSLSMKIEELEQTLLNAQQALPAQGRQAKSPVRGRTGSSAYCDGIKDDDDEGDDDDGPILSIQPAPLRIQPPTPPPAATAGPVNRPQSPFRGPPRRGPLPRRPALEEYGVSSSHVAFRARGGTPTPTSRSGSTDNYSSHSSPPSRANTPQLRHPNRKHDLNQPSPAPTLDAAERPRPRPVVDTGFDFDFGPSPGVGAPPTPDSASCPLASPTAETSTAAAAPPPASEPTQAQAQPKLEKLTPATAKFTRAQVPPPLNLKFNFSPDAPSRDPSLWTPPLRTMPSAASAADGRPSTSAGPSGSGSGSGSGSRSGGGLAASPRLIPQFQQSSAPGDDDPAAFMGIGMARGLSIREVRKSGAAGGRGPGSGAGPGTGPGMVDSFGTGFI